MLFSLTIFPSFFVSPDISMLPLLWTSPWFSNSFSSFTPAFPYIRFVVSVLPFIVTVSEDRISPVFFVFPLIVMLFSLWSVPWFWTSFSVFIPSFPYVMPFVSRLPFNVNSPSDIIFPLFSVFPVINIFALL